MKITKVASAFLDVHCPALSAKNQTSYQTSQDRKPIITPFISANQDSEHGQQYLLIPNKDHVLVMSLEHGQNVCKLMACEDNEDLILQSAVLIKMTKGSMSMEEESNEDSATMDIDTQTFEYVLIAGFSDGTLREWSISSIPYAKNAGKMMPRRVFKLDGCDACISHITSPSGNGSGLVYSLVTEKTDQRKVARMVSFTIPDCNEIQDGIVLDVKKIALFSTKKDTREKNKNTDEDQDAEKEIVSKSLPFSLLSVAADAGNSKMGHFVGVCYKKGLTIYHEESDALVSIPKTQADSEICAAAMSPNGEDIALGYENGKIDVLTSVLTQVADYLNAGDQSADRTHPRDGIVSRTLHWHSLPVKVLCYLGMQGSRATPSLLSGGEEAVLVTWTVDRGLNRPAHTLPRIAKGCITHLATNSHPDSSSNGSMDIVVRGMDDTVQLIQGHNHATRWKVQGLSCSLNECVVPVQPISSDGKSAAVPAPILQMDPKSQMPILTRMAGAPGFAHWFDPKANQVIGELEVAAYNRISRKEDNHKAYPRPTITHMALSSSGNDMITIDTMLSENTGVGNFCNVNSFTSSGDDLSEEMSFVTHIKFWNWSRELEKNAQDRGKGMPYELIAAMPAPHGLTNGTVDALAISPDGTRACTLSTSEGAFHIWAKGKTAAMNSGTSALSSQTPSWTRLCKIAIPAGYSNTSHSECDSSSRVAFSPDGSVLALAFGRHVTLWDHTSATMLNTIHAPEQLTSIHFVRSPLDMILAVGKSSVSVLAPFGNGYLGNAAWSYKLPEKADSEEKVTLSFVTPLVARKELAVTMTVGSHSTTVVIVDLLTGQAKKNQDGSIMSWDVKGSLQSLSDISHVKSNWASETALLLAITNENDMYVMESESKVTKPNVQHSVLRGCFSRIENTNTEALTSNIAPKIENSKRKRIEMDGSVQVKRQSPPNPMAGALLFDSGTGTMDSESGPLLTSQLPALSGSFASSFIARNVKKTS